jgi:hypothetical protein
LRLLREGAMGDTRLKMIDGNREVDEVAWKEYRSFQRDRENSNGVHGKNFSFWLTGVIR